MKAGFIGAGKVGFTLGKYMTEHDVHVSGYYSKNPDSAKEAANFTNSQYFSDVKDLIRECDSIFLTVPDGEIEKVWKSIYSLSIDLSNDLSIKDKQFIHCSGAMSSKVFKDIEKFEAVGLSIHPLFAICDKYRSYKELSEAFFTIEYDENNEADLKDNIAELSDYNNTADSLDYNEEARCSVRYKNLQAAKAWKDIFEGFGNQVRIITSDKKIMYHASAVYASNLIIGMYATATELLEKCGFDKESSERALMPLFMNNCQNIKNFGMVSALTGPVERADDITVSKHLSELKASDREIYRLLSLKLMDVAKEKNPDRDYSRLEELVKK